MSGAPVYRSIVCNNWLKRRSTQQPRHSELVVGIDPWRRSRNEPSINIPVTTSTKEEFGTTFAKPHPQTPLTGATTLQCCVTPSVDILCFPQSAVDQVSYHHQHKLEERGAICPPSFYATQGDVEQEDSDDLDVDGAIQVPTRGEVLELEYVSADDMHKVRYNCYVNCD